MFPPYHLLAISLKQIDCLKQYLDYERLWNCKCCIQFVKNCWSADVIPKFLKLTIPNNGYFDPTAAYTFQKNLLKTLAEHESKVYKKRIITNKEYLQVFHHQNYYHQFYYSHELQYLIHTKMLKQHKFFQIFQKICQMNKGVYLISMILLSCLTLILSHQICIRYFCNGSKKSGIGKVWSESNFSRDRPITELPPRTKYVKFGPNLDLICIWQLNAAPFCENYAKLFLVTKHFK